MDKINFNFFLIFFAVWITSPLLAQTCDGGMVATEENETLIYACVNDGEEDEFEFDADDEADDADYLFIVTNDNNIILKILEDDEADFEDSGVGDCRVYGLSFTGDLLAVQGDQITQTILSTSCFQLSSNYITVVRREIEDTNVTTSTGEDEIEIIDNNNAAFTFINDGQGLANYIYFVIRRSDDRIVDMSEDGFFDFSELEEDRYKVRGYAYSGELVLGVGDRLKGRVSTGCYQKSSSTKVDKEVPSILGDCLPDGGTIETEDGKTMDYVCVSDGNRDEIDFEFRSIASGDYVFILTDENNTVIEILDDDEFNFDGESEGIAHIWGVSYHGDLLIEEGDALLEVTAIATECGELSENFITIFKDILNDTYIETDEGEVSVKITDNEDAVVTVVNDGGAGNADYFYFLRDNATDKIVAMNDTGVFDMAPFDKGKYFVRGYAFTGEIMVSIGDELPADISTGCHEKSENVVTIRKKVDAEIPDPCLANAGTLTIDANPVTIMAGIATVSATPNGDIIVPANYEILYILTNGSNFVVQMFSSFSSFSITTPGNYSIHTLVAELNDFASPDFFNPADIILGETTTAEIMNLIVSQNVCASIDETGASVEVLPGAGCDAAAGTLLADQPLVELGFPPIAIVSATHVIDPVIPVDFEIQYFLVKSGNFIETVGDNPAFVVTTTGLFQIMTFVAETSDPASPDYFDLNNIIPGMTSVADVNDLIDNSGICASIDPIGAIIQVVTLSANNRTEEETEIHEPIDKSISLFPNPVSQNLNISYTATREEALLKAQIQIYTMNGQLVFNQPIEGNSGLYNQKIYVGDLPSGVYLLNVINEKVNRVERFYKN